MPRISPALLRLDRYPFHHRLTTRFADMDRNQHINNVAIATAMEDARFRFDVAAGVPERSAGLRVLIAANYVDYLAEAHYPAPLDVHVGILEIGRSSWTLACMVAQDGRPCAFSRAVNLAADANGPTPMNEAMRRSFERFRIDQSDESPQIRGVALREG